MSIELTALRKYVTPELPGCPLPLVDQTILDLAIEFCDQTQVWTCQLDPINIRDEVTEYDLDPPGGTLISAILLVQIYDPATAPVHPDSWPESPYQDYLREDKHVLELVHAPTRDITKGLHVKVALRPKRACEEPKFGSREFEDWYDGLAKGVMARLMRQDKKSWTNKGLADDYYGLYLDKMRQARIDQSRRRMNTPLRAVAKDRFSR